MNSPITKVFLFMVLVAGAYGLTLEDLDVDVVTEFKYLLDDMPLKPNCGKPQKLDLKFLLYTRDNRHEPIVLDDKYQLSNKKTVLIIHGWLSGPNTTETQHLRNAYLKKYDCNLVIMDWSELSYQRYTTAFCSITRLAFQVSKFLCDFNSKMGVNLKDVHVVAHNVGAHIAGVAGYYVRQRCTQTIGRITGLDPAGPMYQGIIAIRRLDKTDADLVDVIHTDEYQLGYKGDTGTIDYHVNCGAIQPGCPIMHKEAVNPSTEVSKAMCSSLRSIELMAISVNTNGFTATNCVACPLHCRPNMFNAERLPMGEALEKVPKGVSNFYIRTLGYWPFFEG